MSPTNPARFQPPIVRVQIEMMADGTVNAKCEAGDPMAVFHAIGQGTALLATKFREQQIQKEQQEIVLAPAGLLNLPN